MSGRRVWGLALFVVVCLGPAAGRAQTLVTAETDPVGVAMRDGASPPLSVAVVPRLVDASPQPPDQKRGFSGFMADVGSDYRNFFSWSTAEWLSVGGVTALAVHGADEAIREELQDPEAPLTRALEMDGGAQYGNLTAQVPIAVAWWAIGHAMGSERGSAAGRDLVRAQISALSWTYALKYPVDRTRPNGDPRSFPSGHASAAFATAMVLQEHYGWKVGLPVFAAATYTGASRLTVNKHWASDVVFGAVVGMTCGRTVTLHLRNTRVTMAPQVRPGGGAVMFGTMKGPA